MKQGKKLLYTVYTIYFIGGLAQCLEGTFLPEFKEYFTLSYTEQMYTMFAKNIPFLCFSIGIGFITKKVGYKNCLAVSMLLFSLGTYLLVPGLQSQNYNVVLAAFFVIGTAFNIGLVAGNPMLSALGEVANSSSRLNFGNALGALAQIIAPLFVSILIPVTVITASDKMPYIQAIFIATAVVLGVAGITTLLIKSKNQQNIKNNSITAADNKNAVNYNWLQPKIILGFVAIFLMIGTEAGLFGFYRNYLEDKNVMGLSSHHSQQMATLFLALFAAGRLAATYLQKRIKPATTLIVALCAAMFLLVVISFSIGWIAVVAITSIAFFISIFFPTLYAIAVEGLGEETGKASGLLMMGFLGAALLPVLQGKLADTISLPISFLMGIVSYLFVLFYTLKGQYFKSVHVKEETV